MPDNRNSLLDQNGGLKGSNLFFFSKQYYFICNIGSKSLKSSSRELTLFTFNIIKMQMHIKIKHTHIKKRKNKKKKESKTKQKINKYKKTQQLTEVI